MTKLKQMAKEAGRGEDLAFENGYCAGFKAAREMALDEISRNFCFDESNPALQSRYKFIYDNLKIMGTEPE